MEALKFFWECYYLETEILTSSRGPNEIEFCLRNISAISGWEKCKDPKSETLTNLVLTLLRVYHYL